MRCRPLPALALLAALAASPGAAGQPPGARAGELFDEGKALFEQKRFAEACDRLEQSDRLDPSVGTSGLLAACQESRGKLAAALQLYLETAERAKRAGDEREAYARSRAAALDPRVPRLAVRVAEGSPAGMRVTRDGVELNGATLGVELPVDPGVHVVEATATGRAPARVSVDLAAGIHRTITIEAGASLAAPAPPRPEPAPDRTEPPPPPHDGGSLRTIGWIAGGVGLVAVGVAAGTGMVVLGKKGVMDDHCPVKDQKRGCDAEGAAAREDVRPLLPLNAIAWGVGIAGLTTCALFLLTSADRPKSAWIAPAATSAGGGLAAGGRF